MKLSSRSRYAINAMVELATQDHDGETPIVRMAQNYSLSQSSMEQLFARLRRAGLVTGRRGRRGGYRLAQTADQITVAQIVGAVDDEYQARMQAGKSSAKAAKKSSSNSVWDCVSQKLYDFLGEMTLAQVIAKAGSVEKGVRDERSSSTAVAGSAIAGERKKRQKLAPQRANAM